MPERLIRTLGGETCDISRFCVHQRLQYQVLTLGGETCDISHLCAHFGVRQQNVPEIATPGTHLRW